MLAACVIDRDIKDKLQAVFVKLVRELSKSFISAKVGIHMKIVYAVILVSRICRKNRVEINGCYSQFL